MSEKHLKRQTYTLEIKIIFILIFSISVKDYSFKLITFNARLSFSIIEQDLRDWTQNGLFFFCRFSSYSKKITDCVKNDEDIYLPTQSS